MTNHNITCDVVWTTPEGDNIREYKLSPRHRIWPCNYFVLNCDDFDRKSQDRIVDPVIEELKQTDPEWNNLLDKTAEEILEHPVFTEYAWTTGWSGDSPSPICVSYCGKRRSEKIR